MSKMTFPQGSYLFRLTGRKFWEPAEAPQPTLDEASAMIKNCLAYIDQKDETAGNAAVKIAQQFFPDFTIEEIRARYFKKKSTVPHPAQTEAPLPKEEEKEEAPEQTEQKEEKPEAPQKEKKQPAPKKATTTTTDDKTIDQLKNRIGAGIKNFWLYGPAGTGKTTLCKLLADSMDLPCTILSCSIGTSPADVKGQKFPAPAPSVFQGAYGQPGILVIDEITTLEAGIAAVLNAALANGEMDTTTGHVKRHPDCIIIATSNTMGNGADRVYIGNNQLDAATINRFAGGKIKVDYSRTYEQKNFDLSVCEYAWKLREIIEKNNLRRIISTRNIIACDLLKSAGMEWKNEMVEDWTETEKELI